MPEINDAFWQERLKKGRSTCQYLSYARDAHARILRRKAFTRLLPNLPFPLDVLDIGCGDGEWQPWLSALSVRYVGVDRYRWPGWDGSFMTGDMQALPLCSGAAKLGTMITVLPFVADWRQAIAEACRVCAAVLVLDDLRERVPAYQWGLSYKHPLARAEMLQAFAEHGWTCVGDEPVNFLDALPFVHTPRLLWWPVALLALAAEHVMLAAYRWPSARSILRPHVRYRAMLFMP